MKRSHLFVPVAFVYAVSWFLPTVMDQGGGGHVANMPPIPAHAHVMPGYWAFELALMSLFQGLTGEAPDPIGALIHGASALTNAWFIGAFIILARRPRALRRTVFWSLIASGVLNLNWIWFAMSQSTLTLLPGYYLWVASYFALAALALKIAREADPDRSPVYAK